MGLRPIAQGREKMRAALLADPKLLAAVRVAALPKETVASAT